MDTEVTENTYELDDAGVTVGRNPGAMKLEHITSQIIAAAIKVHSALGPGLLENAYRSCLAHELRRAGLFVEIEKPIPIVYDGVAIDVGYRADVLVERQVVIETKAVTNLLPLFRTKLLSQLRMGKFPVGLLINFQVDRLKDGIIRVVI